LTRARERLARHAGLTEWDLAENFTLADALGANPPWVSFSSRHVAPDSTAALPHHRGPGGWPALHAVFLARAARHLAEHGSQGRFFLPASIAELDGYAALRDALEAHAHLVAPPEVLGEDSFPGVHEPALLLHLAAGRRADGAAWSAERTTGDIAPLLDALARFPRVTEGSFADASLHTGNASEHLVFRSTGELHDELARRVRALRPAAATFQAERLQLERLLSEAFSLPPALRPRT